MTAVMLGVTGVALWYVFGHYVVPRGPAEPALPTGPIVVEGFLDKGRTDSRAAVIVFSDFQCPYCAKFATDEMRLVEKNIADAGVALVQFAHYPLERIHSLARVAAQAVECARREQLGWEMHDRLFELTTAASLRTRADVDSAIESASGDDSRRRIIECVDAAQEDQRITSHIKLAGTLGVRSTPTFIIGRRNGSAFFPKKRILGLTTADAIANALRQVSQGR